MGKDLGLLNLGSLHPKLALIHLRAQMTFSRPKAIAHFLSHLRARANETMDGILDRVNGLMLLWTSCRALEDLVSGAILLALSFETPSHHSRLRLSYPH